MLHPLDCYILIYYYNKFLKNFLLKYEVFIFIFISPDLFVIITWYKGGFTYELWKEKSFTKAKKDNVQVHHAGEADWRTTF